MPVKPFFNFFYPLFLFFDENMHKNHVRKLDEVFCVLAADENKSLLDRRTGNLYTYIMRSAA